jgi:hypothetical protein
LSWNDILALQEDEQDIESKGMTPVDLNKLSSKALDFETAGSKKCLESHFFFFSSNWAKILYIVFYFLFPNKSW